MPNERSEILKLVFGSHGPLIYPVISEVSKHLNNLSYEFIEISASNRTNENDAVEFFRTYMLEILYRAHMAAATNIVRTNRWLDGILRGYEFSNFPVFCASYRGFLEASVGAGESLFKVPRFIAKNARAIKTCLDKTGGVSGPGGKEIEDSLIHFLHGKKLSKNSGLPKSHQSKQVGNYIELGGGPYAEEIKCCYAELCEVTHPRAMSVQYMIQSTTAGPRWEYVLSNDMDAAAIGSFLKRHNYIANFLFERGLIPSLMILKLLNKVGLKELYIDKVEQLNIDSIGKYKQFEENVLNEFPSYAR